MGDIRKLKKQYTQPRKRWDKNRIERDKKLKLLYGLKNTKELRRFETLLRKKRSNAKKLLALPLEKRLAREEELIKSLNNYGILPLDAKLDDVLGLNIEDLLEKRLQTIVWRKDFAKTIKQSRQFITHGHIAIEGRKVDAPNYLVRTAELDKINYYKGPLQLEPPKPDKKADLKKSFEEAAGIEEGGESKEKGTGQAGESSESKENAS
jgi:small subunit ribosomal protein S4